MIPVRVIFSENLIGASIDEKCVARDPVAFGQCRDAGSISTITLGNITGIGAGVLGLRGNPSGALTTVFSEVSPDWVTQR
jgi:hypothetical protein